MDDQEREKKKRGILLGLYLAVGMILPVIIVLVSYQASKREAVVQEYLNRCHQAKSEMQACIKEQLNKGNYNIEFCEKMAQIKYDCMQWPTPLKRQHLPW